MLTAITKFQKLGAFLLYKKKILSFKDEFMNQQSIHKFWWKFWLSDRSTWSIHNFLTCCFVVQVNIFFFFSPYWCFLFFLQSRLMHEKQIKDSFYFRSVMVLSPSDDVILLSWKIPTLIIFLTISSTFYIMCSLSSHFPSLI